MSTAHTLMDDLLIPESDFRRFLSTYPQVMEDVEGDHIIDHKWDWPYGAGYSTDGHRAGLDRHIPIVWPMRRLAAPHDITRQNVIKYPIRHELFESAIIRLLPTAELFRFISLPADKHEDALDPKYELAHHLAVRAEWSLVTTSGFDWTYYERQWPPYVKATEHERITKFPPWADLTPYQHDKPLLHHLEHLQRSSRRGAAIFERKKAKANAS